MKAADLEHRLIYSMIVAGKSAAFADAVSGRLYGDRSRSPFDWLRFVRRSIGLDSVLREARSGNYGKLEKGISELIDANIDLANCSAADLEKIHGIGPKTSRFFLLWTRPGIVCAALDTHVLKWLRFIGYPAPKATPTGEKYGALEKQFIAEAMKRQMTPRELDSAIWDWCSRGGHANGIWPAILQPKAHGVEVLPGEKTK